MPSELDDGNLLELTGKFISRLDDDTRDLSDKKCYGIVTAQFNRVQIPHGDDQDGCIIELSGKYFVTIQNSGAWHSFCNISFSYFYMWHWWNILGTVY